MEHADSQEAVTNGPPLPVVDQARSWRRSIPLIYAMIVLVGGIALLSWGMFLFQAIVHVDSMGIPFRAYHGAWMHLLGHLIRAAGLTWVTLCLWRYVRPLQRMSGVANGDWSALGQLLGRIWLSLVVLCWGLVIYAISYLAMDEYPPYPPDDYFDDYYQEKENSASDAGGDQQATAVNRVEFRLATEIPKVGWEQINTEHWSAPLFLAPEALLTSRDVRQATIGLDERESLYLDLTFTSQGGQKSRTATADYEGLNMVILVDQQIVSVSPLGYTLGSQVRITLPAKTLAEIRALAEAIRDK